MNIKFVAYIIVIIGIGFLLYGCEFQRVTLSDEGIIICRAYEKSSSNPSSKLVEDCQAFVTTPEGKQKVYQSGTGKFDINAPISGIYNIKIIKQGYTEASRDVMVMNNEDTGSSLDYKVGISFYYEDFYLSKLSKLQSSNDSGSFE